MHITLFHKNQNNTMQSLVKNIYLLICLLVFNNLKFKINLNLDFGQIKLLSAGLNFKAKFKFLIYTGNKKVIFIYK